MARTDVPQDSRGGVLLNLATKPDLDNLRCDLLAAMHQIQLQSIGIFAVLLGVLFAFIKLT